MKKLKAMMVGDIVLAENPGLAMRKWREVFEVYQSELAKYLKVSPSTISDYESGRRPNPGIKVIKRFVEALFEIDQKRGGHIIKKLTEAKEDHSEYFEVHDFSTSITLRELAEMLKAKVLTNEDLLDTTRVYGYVLLHSVRVMLDMPDDLFKLLGMHAMDKAFIFLDVSTGRSPLIVIRVSEAKPKAVILHGLGKVDELALKISERERVPILTTSIPIDEIKKVLDV